MKDNSIYSCVKSALESLTRTAAAELKDKNIDIFNIKLGPVEIDKGNFDPEVKKEHDKIQEKMQKKMVINRKVLKSDISSTVKLLLDNDIKAFNGEIIDLTGGYGLI